MYDLAVIGGGPGGYNAALAAARMNKKVVLFEKNALGGVCLNEGCIPTKTLLATAKIADKIKHAEAFGVVMNNNVAIDPKIAVARKNRVVKVLTAGIASSLKAAGVTVVFSRADFVKNGYLFEVTANDEKYQCQNLLIAIGGKAFIPNIIGVEEGLKSGKIITNKEAYDLTEIPDKLVIVGGGVIGLETAQYFAAVGSRVTIIEAADKVGGRLDKEIAEVIQKSLIEKGVRFILNASVKEITSSEVIYSVFGETNTECYDKILLSVGRRPDLSLSGLEHTKVTIEKYGIKVNSQMETNVKGLYAVGDAVNIFPLAHTAYRGGEVAVNNMFGVKDEMKYVIPSVIYTSPEAAYVGKSLAETVGEGVNAKEVKIPMSYSGRYAAENLKKDCFIKLVEDVDKHTLIGAFAVGDYSGEYISAVTAFIDLQLDIERLKKIVFPHPTDCEIIREGLFKL